MNKRRSDAMNTNFKVSVSNALTDHSRLIVAYVMAFGEIPSIKETTHGIMLSDAGHMIVTTYQNGIFELETSKSPEECEWIMAAFSRLCGYLNGGTIECSTEYENLTPLLPKVEITATPNAEKILEVSTQDFESFLERPHDDKGFLKEKEWTLEVSTKYHNAILAIDKWYYTASEVEIPLKYLVSKLNLENFILFSIIKNNAQDIDDIIKNIENKGGMYESYTSYLGRYDEDICSAMKKGLICIYYVAGLPIPQN